MHSSELCAARSPTTRWFLIYAGGNVTGNDFNQIVDGLKRLNRGSVLGQVMS